LQHLKTSDIFKKLILTPHFKIIVRGLRHKYFGEISENDAIREMDLSVNWGEATWQ
jgi:hypothetical protein